MPFTACRIVMDRVSAIIDGELGAVARVRFHAHLAMCPPCKRYYEQFVATREAAGVVEPEDLPQDFEQVMSFVMDAIEGPPAHP